MYIYIYVYIYIYMGVLTVVVSRVNAALRVQRCQRPM